MCNLQEYLKELTPAGDRRLKMRVAPTFLVYVTLGGTSGSVVNVSESGMAIAIAVGNLLAVGDYPIRIRFQLPRSRQKIEISAQIVWLAESKKGAGIRFVDLTAEAGTQISNWIESEKLAPDFEKLPTLLRRGKLPIEIEDLAARYEEMFPSESVHGKHPVDENKPQRDPFPTQVRCNTDPSDSMLRAAPKISTGDLLEALSLSQVQTASGPAAPSASNTPVAGFGWQARTDEVKSSADGAGDSASHPYIFDLSGLQLAALVFLFAVIGLIIGIAATKASVDVLASLGRDPFGKRVRLHLQSPHTLPASGLRSDSAPSVSPTEASSAQTSRSSVDQDSSAGANTVGSFRPTEEKYREGTRDAEPSVKVPSTGSNSSPTIESKPSAIPDVSPERNGSGLIARNALPPERAEHAHSAVAVGPIPAARRNRALLTTKPATAAASKSSQMPSPKHAHPAVAAGPFRSAPRNLALLTAKSVTGPAPKPSLPTASPRRPHLAVVVGPRETAPGNPASHPAKPEETEVTKPPVMGTERNQPAVAAGPKGAAPGNSASDSAKSAATAGLRSSPPPSSPRPMNPAVAEGSLGATPRHFTSPTAKLPTVAQPNPVPPANSKPPLPAVPDGPKDAAPGPASPTAKSPTGAQPNPPPAYVVSVPSKSSKPLKLVFPQKQIAFSSSLVITTQLSVLVPPELGLVAAQPTRLQAGKLVSYVLPRNPRPDRYRAEETVKVHATIGQQGLVTEIRPMSGPIFLLSSTMGAVRLWRYKPTLLDGTPIETHQDVTIIFKLPQ